MNLEHSTAFGHHKRVWNVRQCCLGRQLARFWGTANVSDTQRGVLMQTPGDKMQDCTFTAHTQCQKYITHPKYNIKSKYEVFDATAHFVHVEMISRHTCVW